MGFPERGRPGRFGQTPLAGQDVAASQTDDLRGLEGRAPGATPTNPNWIDATFRSSIPTGLDNSARRCAHRATPGRRSQISSTLKGLHPLPWSLIQPRWG